MLSCGGVTKPRPLRRRPENLNQSDVFLILYSLDSSGGEGGPGGDFISAPLLAEACFLAGLKEVVHEIFSGGGAP